MTYGIFTVVLQALNSLAMLNEHGKVVERGEDH